MSHSARILAVGMIFLGLAAMGFWDSASAQQTQRSKGRTARPQQKALRVEKLSPQLEWVLRQWEAHSSKIERLQGKGRLYTYLSTFGGVEKRGVIEFKYEAPDKGSYLVKPAKISRGQKSKKKNRQGEFYLLKPDQPQRWVATGTQVFKVDDHEKTYHVFDVPPEQQGKNVVRGPLPFLFGMKAEAAKMRYSFRLLHPLDETPGQVWIEAVPRFQSDKRNYKYAWIILDRKTFLPKAVQLVKPDGTSKTKHIFDKVEVNPKRRFWQRGRNFIAPSVKGYTRVKTGGSGGEVGSAKISSRSSRKSQLGEKSVRRTGYPPPISRRRSSGRKSRN